eukprot:7097322-Pyramimonas_sp.AAC.1
MLAEVCTFTIWTALRMKRTPCGKSGSAHVKALFKALAVQVQVQFSNSHRRLLRVFRGKCAPLRDAS